MRLRVAMLWVGCLLILAACRGGGKEILPTFTPDLPSATVPPSETPRPTRQPVTQPPAATLAPSWTPQPTRTPAPTRTPVPTRTPQPGHTPTDIPQTPEFIVLDDGSIQIFMDEAQLNAALQPAIFTIAPDRLTIQLEVENPFLNATSEVEAEVALTLEPAGLQLALLSFEVSGTQVTEAEVQEALDLLEPQLSQAITQRYQDSLDSTASAELIAVDLEWGAIAVTIKAR